MTSLLAQTGFLVAGTLVVYGLAWAIARAALRLVGGGGRAWTVGLPWACLQLYLVVGLLATGALPGISGGFAAVLAVTAVASLTVALARRRPEAWRVRALLLAWALPWLGALAYLAL